MTRKTWFVVIAVWLSVGVVDAIRLAITGPAFAPNLDLRMAFEWALADALTWVVLSPIPIVLARRYPLRRPHLGRDVAIHAVAAVAVGFTHVLVDVSQNVLGDVLDGRPADFATNFGYIAPYSTHLMILTYAIIVGVTRMVDVQMSLRDAQARSLALQGQLAEARLHALQARLRPHFLFNALHTGSALVDRDPEAARTVLNGLGKLLRQSLSVDERTTVPLREELEIVSAYLDVESARYGARLRTTIDVDDDVLGAALPPFLIQPLVENAIRHGIAPLREGGHLEVRAARVGTQLRIVVTDDGVGLAPDARDGTGLSTTRSRLEVLHGDRAGLDVAGAADGGTRVIVELPFVEDPKQPEEVTLADRDRR